MITSIKDTSNLKNVFSEREISKGVFVSVIENSCKNCHGIKIYQLKNSDIDLIEDRCICGKEYMTAKNNSLFHKRFKNVSFEDIHKEGLEKQYAQCLEYAKNFDQHLKTGSGLILAGSSGLGKTMLCATIGKYILDNHKKSVIMQSTSELFELIIKNDFNYDNLVNCHLLILDDVGREKLTEWVKQTFFNIIDIRYRNRLPIVCTTNQTVEVMYQHFQCDPAILDRILEVCKPIKFSGKSYRLKKRIKNA